MPQIKMRNIDKNKICSFSKEMIDELESILKCPRSYFTIEHFATTAIKDGEVVEGYPFVEIDWFDRGQEIQDEVAKVVTKYVHNSGYKDVDVIFSILDEKRYYENGEHY